MFFAKLLLTAALGAAALPILAQAPEVQFVKLSQQPPPETLSAIPTGALPAGQVLHLSLSIPYRDPAGMQQFVDAVSNPKSPQYRHFLTPAQIGERFGQSTATVQQIASYLTSNGMKINLIGANRLSILFEATVAQASAAFNTTFSTYSNLQAEPVSGKGPLWSYTTAPSVPAEIRPYVLYLGGMETFNRPHPWQNPLTPVQLSTYYNTLPLQNANVWGQGRTVGISNFDGYYLEDLPGWYTGGEPQFNPGFWTFPEPGTAYGSNVRVDVVSGFTTGEDAATANPEGDLDIQCVLGQAPLCNLVIYDEGPTQNADEIAMLTTETDDNKADIITESYGWRGSSDFYAAAHDLHLSMSGQGITFMCASGDAGTANMNYNTGFPYPDMDPEVLTVGGTATGTSQFEGPLTSQTGWANKVNGQLQGSGGGWTVSTDAFNALPSWQTGTGVPTDIPYRLVPDVALNADDYNSPCLLYLVTGDYGASQSDLYEGFGGTSEASPTFAGCLAVAEQQVIANGALPADGSGHQRFGRIANLIYSFNGSSQIFTDVTSDTGGLSTGTLPDGTQANAGSGWDFVTGWGVMNFDNFVTAVSNAFSVKLNPSTVTGGLSSTGTVTLPSPASPAGGVVVTLSSSSADATVPSSVTVAQGQTSASFTITTTAYPANVNSTITARQGSASAKAVLTIDAPVLASLALNPTTVTGGSTSTGTVTLTGPAPSAGTAVTLSSSSACATVPASVTVAAGATSATFTVSTTPYSSNISATITAARSGSTSQKAVLSISAPVLASLTLNPTTVTGGSSSTGTVTINGPAPSAGTAVTLTSSSADATVPGSVTVPAGATSATFTVTTISYQSNVSATITASRSGSTSQKAVLSISAPVLASLTLNPTTVTGGSSSTGTVTLNGPAPSVGTAVTLSSSSADATVPASVTVAAGQTSATFTVTTISYQSNVTATITAARSGSTSQKAVLSISAPVLASLTLNPTTVTGGSSSTGTVTLNGPAPSTGFAVTLTSSSADATVPASVTLPAGAISATFTISTTSYPSTVTATITASRSGSTSQKAVLTITAPVLSSLSLNPTTVTGGTSSTGTVTLTGPAPAGGFVVSLASSSADAQVPASVTVPAGATSATFTITTTTYPGTVDATITASKSGSTSQKAVLTITPG